MSAHDVRIRRRFLATALVLAVTVTPLRAAEDGGTESERLIRAEHGVARTALAAPYTLFSLTSWPLRWTINWMEEASIPARVEDAALFPLRFFGDDEDDDDDDEGDPEDRE